MGTFSWLGDSALCLLEAGFGLDGELGSVEGFEDVLEEVRGVLLLVGVELSVGLGNGFF